MRTDNLSRSENTLLTLAEEAPTIDQLLSIIRDLDDRLTESQEREAELTRQLEEVRK